MPAAAASGSERHPSGDLLLTSGRPCKEHIGDVGARDQQHQPDGAQQHQQCRGLSLTIRSSIGVMKTLQPALL